VLIEKEEAEGGRRAKGADEGDLKTFEKARGLVMPISFPSFRAIPGRPARFMLLFLIPLNAAGSLGVVAVATTIDVLARW